MAPTGYGEESYGLCSVPKHGCADGRRPFAGGFGGVPQLFVLAQEQAEKQSVSDGSLRVSPNLQSPLGVGDQRGLKHE